MLAFDMRQMSSQAIQMAVEACCADYGSVDTVKVIPCEEGIRPALALVLMSCRNEALQLHRELGDALAGQIVVIFLHDRANAQTALHHRAPASSSLSGPS